MGIAYNSKIITNGLVACYDAGNPTKSARGFKNLLDLSTWTIGTDGTSNFYRNGTVAENRRILDTGPFGYQTVVWDTPSSDATSDDDGGWTGAGINIDPTKMYRFSVWIRRKVVGNGYTYMGCQAWDVTAQQVLNRSNGATNQNPYFYAGWWNGNANEWYLLVGHIWPAGSGTGSAHVNSNIYTTTGTIVTSTGDFVWQSTNTYTLHRSYLYYTTDTTTNQQWYQPRIDLIDGTEPTISELLSGVGSRVYNLVGTNHANIYNSAALYNSNGYLNFDGVDDYAMTSSFGALPNTGTISFWMRSTAVENYRNPLSTNYQGVNTGFRWEQYTTPSPYGGFSVIVGNDAGVYTNFQYLTSTVISPNVWYNVVMTWNKSASAVTGYLNGDLKFDVTNHTYWPTNLSSICMGNGFSGDRYFKGHLSNVTLYNRALSAAEVKQNFGVLRGRYSI